MCACVAEKIFKEKGKKKREKERKRETYTYFKCSAIQCREE